MEYVEGATSEARPARRFKNVSVAEYYLWTPFRSFSERPIGTSASQDC
jgi:hypothetical protein